jgi:hypothetical protein
LDRYYFDRRQPVDPESQERFVTEIIEQKYLNDFSAMASKNNLDRPRAEREYFDRPINFQR